MPDYSDRLRALELAVEFAKSTEYPSHFDVVGTARSYLDFMLGTRDAEIVSAALALAEKVRA